MDKFTPMSVTQDKIQKRYSIEKTLSLGNPVISYEHGESYFDETPLALIVILFSNHYQAKIPLLWSYETNVC